MLPFLLTALASVFMFCLFGVGIMVGVWFGRRRQRRCACAAAKEVLRTYEARERAAKSAARYDRQTVDPSNLPIVSAELGGLREKI